MSDNTNEETLPVCVWKGQLKGVSDWIEAMIRLHQDAASMTECTETIEMSKGWEEPGWSSGKRSSGTTRDDQHLITTRDSERRKKKLNGQTRTTGSEIGCWEGYQFQTVPGQTKMPWEIWMDKDDTSEEEYHIPTGSPRTHLPRKFDLKKDTYHRWYPTVLRSSANWSDTWLSICSIMRTDITITFTDTTLTASFLSLFSS